MHSAKGSGYVRLSYHSIATEKSFVLSSYVYDSAASTLLVVVSCKHMHKKTEVAIGAGRIQIFEKGRAQREKS